MSDLEKRLTGAFTALADAVDPADPRPTSRPPRNTRRVLVVAAAATVAALVIGGAILALRPTPNSTPAPPAAERTTTPANPSPAIPYSLYTHCGIDEAKIGDTFYEAVTPLHDGAHNPPSGWDNPYQEGTMTITSDTEAVFRDDKGHEVVFKIRPGATAFKHLCR